MDVSMDLIRNRPTEAAAGPLRLPAGMVEGAVVGEVRRLLGAPEMVARTIQSLRAEGVAMPEAAIVAALREFDQLWTALYPAEQARLIQLLVERVRVGADGMEVDLRPQGLGGVVRDLLASRPMEGGA
jgi:hypothetical protein